MSPRAEPGRVGVGLDGCRNGWVVAVLEHAAHSAGPGTPGTLVAPRLRVITRMESLPGVLMELGVQPGCVQPGSGRPGCGQPSCCLVDIPIGLVGSGRRELDVLAAAALGGKRSSVFAVPPRGVFDALDFQEAGLLARDAMGQGLTLQAWNIMDKIREVDLYLRRRRPLPPDLRESHPELVFARLAVSRPHAARPPAATPGPLPSKKSPEGISARIAILEAHGVDARSALAAPPDHAAGRIARDDLLDAIALAVVAARPVSMQDVLRGAQHRDALGLPMEMVLPSIEAPGEA